MKRLPAGQNAVKIQAGEAQPQPCAPPAWVWPNQPGNGSGCAKQGANGMAAMQSTKMTRISPTSEPIGGIFRRIDGSSRLSPPTI